MGFSNKFTSRLKVAAATMAAFAFACGSAEAGYNTWTSTSLGEGVTLKNKVYPSLYGGKQTVNVVEVDLNEVGVSVKPIDQQSSGVCETTSSMGSRTGAVAAINGGFFGSCSSVSMVKIDNNVLHTNPGWKPARATFGYDQSTKTPSIDWVSSTNSWSSVDDALGGGPNLVSAGSSNVTLSQEGFASSYANKNPRTALGYTNGGLLLLVTVDGRTSAGVGMTLNELSSYMIALGCDEAMNLDGGGSTTMWADSQGVVNTPSDGYERGVASGLGVYITEDATIVDNGGSDYSETGSWGTSSSSGYYGSSSRYAFTGGAAATATWTPNLSKSGVYDVYAWWVAGSNRANNAVYSITHMNGTNNIPADQSANGGKWNYLGTYDFASGTSGDIVLTDSAQASKVVSADAVKLVYTGPVSQPDVIADNEDSGFSKSGSWWASSSTSGYYGSNYHVRATESTSDAAGWSQTLPTSGDYKVYARWTAGGNRASAAPYVVYHNGGSTTVTANQQQNNGQWVLLGTFNMNAGTATRVVLSCWTSSGTYVIADAVKFEKVN